MNEVKVPTWAKEAVAQGWTWHQEDNIYCYDHVRRTLANKLVLRIFDDGSGGDDDWGLVGEKPRWDTAPVSETLKLANEYAAANGGWA